MGGEVALRVTPGNDGDGMGDRGMEGRWCSIAEDLLRRADTSDKEWCVREVIAGAGRRQLSC